MIAIVEKLSNYGVNVLSFAIVTVILMSVNYKYKILNYKKAKIIEFFDQLSG